MQHRLGLLNALATAHPAVLPNLRAVLRSLQTQITKLDGQLAATLRADPELHRQAKLLRKLLCLCVGVLRSNQPWNPTGRPSPKTSGRKASPY